MAFVHRSEGRFAGERESDSESVNESRFRLK